MGFPFSRVSRDAVSFGLLPPPPSLSWRLNMAVLRGVLGASSAFVCFFCSSPLALEEKVAGEEGTSVTLYRVPFPYGVLWTGIYFDI